MLKSFWVEWTSQKKVKFAFATETENDLNYLVDLVASKRIKPVIDKIYPLEQTREAHRYVAQSLKKGSVVISVR
jgi:NADPH:quinone reductase-like Zn-dependent oxidoreductase